MLIYYQLSAAPCLYERLLSGCISSGRMRGLCSDFLSCVRGVCDETNHIATNNALLSDSHLIAYTPLNLNVSLFLISDGLPLLLCLLDVVFMLCTSVAAVFFAFIPLYRTRFPKLGLANPWCSVRELQGVRDLVRLPLTN